MKMRFSALAVVAALVLSACGGDNNSASPSLAQAANVPAAYPEPPIPASTPTPSTPVVQILALGDDAMEGVSMNQYGMPSIVAPNAPTALQAILQKSFNDTGITVQNGATGGRASTLGNELAGMDGGGAALPDRIAQSQAAIVIDNHAVNDSISGEPLSWYQSYLGQWIADVRAQNKIPVLEEPGPVCDGQHPQLPQYVAAMDAAAQQYNVPIIKQYDFVQGILGWETHMTGCLYPDAALDAAKAQQEAAVITPLVRSIIGSKQ